MSEAKPSRLREPVEIARVALRNLTARGLPPTPENYTREYGSVIGSPEPSSETLAAGVPGPEMVLLMNRIVEQVSATSAELASGVDRFEVDTRPLLAQLELVPDQEAFSCLVQAFMRSTLSLQRTVEISRLELGEIREQLDQANGELNRTKALANTDPLTGLFNRRALNECMVRDIARARRSKEAYSVAIIDIDHFKKVNDQYGHAAGDRALLHLAFVAKSSVRDTDVICRYGGEEFIILLPGAGAEGTHFVIDRLRMMIEKTPFKYESEKISIRFSAGVAALCKEEDAAQLLARADQALYEAKRAGRNRVSIALVPPIAA